MVSASLIISGLMSVIQIKRFRLGRSRYTIGSGLISLSGPSFTFLPIAEAAIAAAYADGTCPPAGPDGFLAPCPDAFGRYLGTVAVGSLLEVALSFLPPRAIKRLFPPLVSGVTVFLIGAALIGAGMSYWAGGAGPCMAYRLLGGEAGGGSVPEIFAECPSVFAPQTTHPWGDGAWIGLGAVVFGALLALEVVGSPFMRSAQILLALGVGFAVAAATGHVGTESIADAPAVTFLWARTFKLGFYAPALLPILIASVVTMVESVGDISASCSLSGVATAGPEFESRIQGGILADGVNSIVAVLMTGNPTTTFSENNGVIAITRCANRTAGYWACFWLVLSGVIGKIGGLFVAIPDAVIGGMTTFLFANVAVSGVRILATLDWDRRDRFIVSASLALGLGVSLVPRWFSYVFTYGGDSDALRGFLDAVEITVGTGYCVGSFMAMGLNLLLPIEAEDDAAADKGLIDDSSTSGDDVTPASTEGSGGEAVPVPPMGTGGCLWARRPTNRRPC
eukprot:TRINITY_DN2202_c0_g1_i4.p1 TRINITY_DN2202_c0_g1~~TRINITY_DN2202_c0_g1_i4.p1  ORF type:complete len:508 (-),score=198.00 TRINITY_DN2202_c0_g1_i4:154-1677(-)